MAVKRSRGRPRALTSELRAKIVEAIRKGSALADAAALAGIDRATLRRARLLDAGFNAQVEAAIARWTDSIQKEIFAAIKAGDMISARWMLEKRRRDLYGVTADVPAPEIHVENNTFQIIADPSAAVAIDELFVRLSERVRSLAERGPSEAFEPDV